MRGVAGRPPEDEIPRLGLFRWDPVLLRSVPLLCAPSRYVNADAGEAIRDQPTAIESVWTRLRPLVLIAHLLAHTADNDVALGHPMTPSKTSKIKSRSTVPIPMYMANSLMCESS
jgi:hypothetical protein